ncbi:FAD:protein FMN transferase [Flavilitoribacter nigricans]|uniref:FAD:protein FMN transferase n=1 Tax=Flavilitoribacter nigricans TaxID=70997 RepID=UPI001475B695|nr:FAD:protein FMN transferase [Flavilitoribacter nigricans]
MRFSLLSVLLLNFLCAPTAQAQELRRFEFSEPKMGTTFRMVFYAEREEEATQAAAAAFERIDELNRIFSDYQEDSEVSRLSQSAGSGEKVPVSDELWEVLHYARQLSKKSNGAFDVSIGPLSKLWRRAFRQMEFPQPEKITAARALVNYRDIRLYRKHRRVRLCKAGMRIDLGGIAKGYTVDAVYRVLLERGINRALVDGGGDIYAGDPPPGQSGWEVQMVALEEGVDPQRIVLSRRAIASSGSTYKFLEWNGERYSHIIDPRTGLGITETDIINVAADNCMQADAFASTLSIINDLERTRLLDRFPNVALQKTNE